MRFHVLEVQAFRRSHTGDRRDLIENEIFRFARRDLHRAASEADEVRDTRVRADRDAALPGQTNRLAQHARIAGVKTCRDVRRGDRLHQPGIVADGVGAERLAHVGVEVDSQRQARRF